MLKVESFTPLKKCLALLALAFVCAFGMAATTSTFHAAPVHAASVCRWLTEKTKSETVNNNYEVTVELNAYVETADTSSYCGKWESYVSVIILYGALAGTVTPKLSIDGATAKAGTAVPLSPPTIPGTSSLASASFTLAPSLGTNPTSVSGEAQAVIKVGTTTFAPVMTTTKTFDF